MQGCFPAAVQGGAFQLDQNTGLQQDTTLLGQGATDAFDAKYFNGSTEVDVTLAGYPDTTTTQGQINTDLSNLTNGGCQAQSPAPIPNTNPPVALQTVDCSGSSQFSGGKGLFVGQGGLIFGTVDGPDIGTVTAFAAAFVTNQ